MLEELLVIYIKLLNLLAKIIVNVILIESLMSLFTPISMNWELLPFHDCTFILFMVIPPGHLPQVYWWQLFLAATYKGTVKKIVNKMIHYPVACYTGHFKLMVTVKNFKCDVRSIASIVFHVIDLVKFTF